MRTRKIMGRVLLGVLVAAAVGGDAAEASKARRKEVERQDFYLKNNIWYQHPAKMMNVNYHVGTILPVGSKVTIKKIRGGNVDFWVEGRKPVFRILFIPKYAGLKEVDGKRRRETIWDFFDKYFQKTDPTAPGGPFDMVSDDERRLIMTGQIAVGMSKWAVLRAYGYPPGHKTPSWKSNTWTYWVTKYSRKIVTFENDRVVNIQG